LGWWDIWLGLQGTQELVGVLHPVKLFLAAVMIGVVLLYGCPPSAFGQGLKFLNQPAPLFITGSGGKWMGFLGCYAQYFAGCY
jgi:hypothetical protein